MKRDKVISGIGLAILFASLLFIMTASTSEALTYTSGVVGYAEGLSNYNAAGDTVNFHLSSQMYKPLDVTIFIYKIGEDKLIPVDGQKGIVISGSELKNLPCKQSELGCDWPLVYALDVNGWESGLYYAYLVDGNLSEPPPNIIIGSLSSENFHYIPFIIKSANPVNKILVQLPANTWHAWNGWNGGSYYYSDPNTTVLSFQRPFDKKFAAIKDDSYEFFKWLNANGYAYDVAIDTDIEEPTFVARYKLIIPVGHGEYWTTKMYDSLVDFRNHGGNILFLSSNTMYWRNRYNRAAHTLESYKIAWLSEDPCYDPDAPDYSPQLVTSYFSPARLPQNKDAIDWEHNDIKLMGIHGDEHPGMGGYTFFRTNDEDVKWIFAGTDLKDGDRIGDLIGLDEETGKKEPQVGAAGSNEVDRVRVVFQDGLPFADRTNWMQLDKCNTDNPDFDMDYCVRYAPAPDAPENLKILGLGDSSNREQNPETRKELEGATLSIYKSRDDCAWGACSTVVHVGSWNWAAKALNAQLSNYDDRFSTITKNLIDKMTAGPNISQNAVKRYQKVSFQQGAAGYSGFTDTTISYSAIDTHTEVLQVRGLNAQYSLIQADITQIPHNAKIDSATLLLYGAMPGYKTNTMLIDARRVLDDWDETTTQLPKIQFDEITRARVKIHLSGEGAGKQDWGMDKWHSFNITPFVQRWHNDPKSNHGVALFNPINNLRYTFRSSDYPDSHYHPILTIVYSVPQELTWDMDGDCDVDVLDVQYVSMRWGAKVGDPNYDPRADIDGNGEIDIFDVQAIAWHWGSHCEEQADIYYGKTLEDISAKHIDSGDIYLPLILLYRRPGSPTNTPTPTLTPPPTVTPTPTAPTEIYLSPSNSTHSMANGVFTQDIDVRQASGVAAFEFSLHFEPSILRVISVDFGDFLSIPGCTVIPVGPIIDNAVGTVKYGAASFGACGASGSGTLSHINFQPTDIGISWLHFNDTKLGDASGNPLAHISVDGQVAIEP